MTYEEVEIQKGDRFRFADKNGRILIVTKVDEKITEYLDVYLDTQESLPRASATIGFKLDIVNGSLLRMDR